MNDEFEKMERMFHAACVELGMISKALDLDPDDGGAKPILDAIQKLKDERDQWADVGYAVASQGYFSGISELIIRDVCEMEPANPDLSDTICIDVSDLQAIVKRHMESQPISGVAAIREVIHELRTYHPPGDPYNGKHIHPGWARRLEKALHEATPVPLIDNRVVGAFRMLLAACNRLWAEAEEIEGPDGLAQVASQQYWDKFVEARDKAQAAFVKIKVCETCNGNGLIGGPSFYAPDEGGQPCPDCGSDKYS